MGSLTAQEFIHRWKNTNLSERAGSHSHFIDLCHLLDEPTPSESDQEGSWYTFEAGTKKAGGGHGWADVWKKDCFAWEYKRNHRDLKEAYKQLVLYSRELYNPPLLIVSDMDTIDIHTNFTNSIPKTHHLELESLEDPKNLHLLKQAFSEPEKLNPEKERETLTSELAKEFAAIARSLRERGHSPHQVANFVNKIVFCLFAENIGLLPKEEVFKSILKRGLNAPTELPGLLNKFFQSMKEGGDFGEHKIDWFNGGIFSDNESLLLIPEEIKNILEASKYDWSEVSATIFGQMFERGLDPDARAQLGAHYTGKNDIIRVLEPVVLLPLQEKWRLVKEQCQFQLASAKRNKQKETHRIYSQFLEELRATRVLDPACGSASFLYTTLQLLKDFEHQVMCEAEKLKIRQREFPEIGPSCLLGIDTNEYAVELAKVTIWIGEIQWMIKNGFGLRKKPILNRLDNIQKRDALVNVDGTEAQWPTADFIVGNPPFLGDKRQLTELGEEDVSKIRKVYKGRVPAGADLVTYWLEKTAKLVKEGKVKRAGFVTTNSVRAGQNRKVIENLLESCTIYNAWSDEPWTIDGASVRISIICFANKNILNAIKPLKLNGKEVKQIFSNLTGSLKDGPGYDITLAKILKENQLIAFIGDQKSGPFEVSGDLAREWIKLSFNANKMPNSNVLFPWINGRAIVQRPSDTWIIDFNSVETELEASLYEKPYNYIFNHVKPERNKHRQSTRTKPWWIHECPRPEMREAIRPLQRYIATPRVAKHRLFVWVDKIVLPDSRLVTIASEDDIMFGLLHSYYHQLWTLKICPYHGVGNHPTYSHTVTFLTFPFPSGFSPDLLSSITNDNPLARNIRDIAKRLNELRENWLNPPELIKRIPEVVSGYPDRILPIDAEAELVLKERTLTNLYNKKPHWLISIHKELDSAVAKAYGWPEDLTDDEILERLLQLNLERATHQ
ncbi:MAG: N-6 DNA methylase [Alphaproteobacteria bacterium]|jgi:type II restriction/modification system DNA methylase subunit YeeA|nr:N-6 DNA methylase [Alphaproteobacteria bacterium]